MFKWLTAFANNIFFFEFKLDLYEFRFHFELFNLILRFDVPLPFGWLSKASVLKTFWYNTFEFNKQFYGTKNRTLEVQVFFDPTLPIGISMQKQAGLNDHDPYNLQFCCLVCLDLTLIHGWHVIQFDDDREDRFPTEGECKQIVEYENQLKQKMFGGRVPEFSDDLLVKKKVTSYFKKLDKFKERLFYENK